MTKKDQIKGFEETINDIPLVIDPCKMCKVYKKHKGCKGCNVLNYVIGK